MTTFRVALVLLLVFVTPLVAQVVGNAQPASSEAETTGKNPPSEKPAEASEPARKLRIISEGQTANFIAKFDGAGVPTDSIMFENNGKVGIGTTDPKVFLHLYGGATSDVAAGFGPDPSVGGGPAMYIGYAGATVGRSAGYFNVRPDSLAVAPNPSLRFATGDVQRMIITNTGKVGIGTSLPLAPMHVNGTSSQSQLYITKNDSLYTGLLSALSYSADNVSLGFDVDWSATWRARASTVAWLYKSDGHFKLIGSGNNTIDAWPGINIYQDTDLTTGVTEFRSVSEPNSSAKIAGGMVHLTGYPTQIKFGNNQFIQDTSGGNMRIFAGANLTVDTSAGGDIVLAPGSTNLRVTGNVVASNSATIGPSGGDPAISRFVVNGSAHFNGTVTGTNIKAHYQDVAEWVPSTSDLSPGTVVILNRGRNNEVMASAAAYDTAVAGVVSGQPGISLGIEGEGKEQIATTGRVKVRVDARMSPVGVGDLLVTSATPGMAMRSEPMEIGGHRFHKPGTIIGKALEPLEGSVGEILVLLSMQ